MNKLAARNFNKVLLQLNEPKCWQCVFLPHQKRFRHNELDFRNVCKIRQVNEKKNKKRGGEEEEKNSVEQGEADSLHER
jgi:hypothetical protein